MTRYKPPFANRRNLVKETLAGTKAQSLRHNPADDEAPEEDAEEVVEEVEAVEEAVEASVEDDEAEADVEDQQPEPVEESEVEEEPEEAEEEPEPAAESEEGEELVEVEVIEVEEPGEADEDVLTPDDDWKPYMKKADLLEYLPEDSEITMDNTKAEIVEALEALSEE